MEKDNILRFFSAFSFSDETGVAKPQKKAYQSILNQFSSINPEEIMHCGDLERTDVAGALNMGMYACRYIGLSNNIDNETYSTNAHITISDWKDLLTYIEPFNN